MQQATSDPDSSSDFCIGVETPRSKGHSICHHTCENDTCAKTCGSKGRTNAVQEKKSRFKDQSRMKKLSGFRFAGTEHVPHWELTRFSIAWAAFHVSEQAAASTVRNWGDNLHFLVFLPVGDNRFDGKEFRWHESRDFLSAENIGCIGETLNNADGLEWTKNLAE